MGAAKIMLTAEEFDNYPFEEDKRYELDEGELIEMTRPAYKHNIVMPSVLVALVLYFRKNRLGEALLSENLYALSPNTRLAPDVAVILGDRRAELLNAKVIPIIPDIVVEVLSPSETPRKVLRKLKRYFTAGVKEVWLIDPETKTAEIWTGPALPEHELTVADALTSPLLPGFALALGEVFA
ncbi:MAG TPA: Uma2 family endonuclease [Bryobacteraceae bacterium]|nr:Uma2 family endonuclease [Bryobacteraceae bacterium]